MNSKLIGGILLVVGTTIGAGMLALPIATAQMGFLGSCLLLVGCWLLTIICASLFIEVNLWFPRTSNYISMAGITLGKTGQTIAWITYLFLLYSFLCAYISGGGDLFHYLFATSGMKISLAWSSAIFTFLLSLIVYFGLRTVDYVNRGLIFGKLGAFIVLVVLALPFISKNNLAHSELIQITSPSTISIAIVAFTCIMIIPSLRVYFGDDAKTLRKVIFYGTLIPLVCYMTWNMAVMGIIPLEGQSGLQQILHSSSVNSDVVKTLSNVVHSDVVTSLAKFFTSICMITSFLGISLCLTDFLSDGLSLSKKGSGGIVIQALTFLPPLAVVLFYPGIFIRGLNYAGIGCFILMVFLPPLMVWRGRYYQALAKNNYRVGGGKLLLLALVVFAALMIGFGVEGVG